MKKNIYIIPLLLLCTLMACCANGRERTQSYDAQYKFGIETLKKFGWNP